MRGPCQLCQAKAIERDLYDFIATPEKLRHHPDLAELERMLESLYG